MGIFDFFKSNSKKKKEKNNDDNSQGVQEVETTQKQTESEKIKKIILNYLDNLDVKGYDENGTVQDWIEKEVEKSNVHWVKQVKDCIDDLVAEQIITSKFLKINGLYKSWYQSEIHKEKVEKAEKEKKEKAKVAKENRRNNLIEKYGEEFGIAILSKKILNDMTSEMVIDSLGEPKYKDSDKWYYGTKKSFKKFIEFKNNKVVGESKCDGVWLDMPLELLIASMGKPADEKKNITKKGTKIKLYFGARKTRQKTTVYKLEVRLEDDVVVGFRELE
jgi:hypothetical protein